MHTDSSDNTPKAPKPTTNTGPTAARLAGWDRAGALLAGSSSSSRGVSGQQQQQMTVGVAVLRLPGALPVCFVVRLGATVVAAAALTA
jgi:hypothetical protein